MPIYLISKTDFAPYVDISSNLADTKLQPRILEAQNFDLRPLFGDQMWFDYYVETPDVKYSQLLTGGTYVVNGVTYQFDSIKPILVYFTAARLIRSLDFHITPNGIMQKRNDFSDHVDTKAIAIKVTEYQNLALAYWESVAGYINNAGKTIFPLYQAFTKCGTEPFSSRPKMYGVKGRDTQDQYFHTGKTYGGR